MIKQFLQLQCPSPVCKPEAGNIQALLSPSSLAKISLPCAWKSSRSGKRLNASNCPLMFRNKDIGWPDSGKPMVHKPLIRHYCWGGYVTGGSLTSHHILGLANSTWGSISVWQGKRKLVQYHSRRTPEEYTKIYQALDTQHMLYLLGFDWDAGKR